MARRGGKRTVRTTRASAQAQTQARAPRARTRGTSRTQPTEPSFEFTGDEAQRAEKAAAARTPAKKAKRSIRTLSTSPHVPAASRSQPQPARRKRARAAPAPTAPQPAKRPRASRTVHAPDHAALSASPPVRASAARNARGAVADGLASARVPVRAASSVPGGETGAAGATRRSRRARRPSFRAALSLQSSLDSFAQALPSITTPRAEAPLDDAPEVTSDSPATRAGGAGSECSLRQAGGASNAGDAPSSAVLADDVAKPCEDLDGGACGHDVGLPACASDLPAAGVQGSASDTLPSKESAGLSGSATDAAVPVEKSSGEASKPGAMASDSGDIALSESPITPSKDDSSVVQQADAKTRTDAQSTAAELREVLTPVVLPVVPADGKALKDVRQTTAAALSAKEMIPSHSSSPVVSSHAPDAPRRSDVDSLVLKASLVGQPCPDLCRPKGDVTALPAGGKGPDASKEIGAEVSSPIANAVGPVDLLQSGPTPMETDVGQANTGSVMKSAVEQPMPETNEEGSKQPASVRPALSLERPSVDLPIESVQLVSTEIQLNKATLQPSNTSAVKELLDVAVFEATNARSSQKAETIPESLAAEGGHVKEVLPPTLKSDAVDVASVPPVVPKGTTLLSSVPDESIEEQMKASVSPKADSPVCQPVPERDDAVSKPSTVASNIAPPSLSTAKDKGETVPLPVPKSIAGADLLGIGGVVTGDLSLEPSNIQQEANPLPSSTVTGNVQKVPTQVSKAHADGADSLLSIENEIPSANSLRTVTDEAVNSLPLVSRPESSCVHSPRISAAPKVFAVAIPSLGKPKTKNAALREVKTPSVGVPVKKSADKGSPSVVSKAIEKDEIQTNSRPAFLSKQMSIGSDKESLRLDTPTNTVGVGEASSHADTTTGQADKPVKCLPLSRNGGVTSKPEELGETGNSLLDKSHRKGAAASDLLQTPSVDEDMSDECLPPVPKTKVRRSGTGKRARPGVKPGNKTILKSGNLSGFTPSDKGRVNAVPVEVVSSNPEAKIGDTGKKTSPAGDAAKKGTVSEPPISALASSTKERPQRSAPLAKRVRFTEPSQPLRTSGRNSRLLQLMRRRQQRSLRRLTPDSPTDLSLASAGVCGPDQRSRQVLIDELQYILDGVFKIDVESETGANLVTTSLQSLVKLLLHKEGRTGDLGASPPLDGVIMHDDSILQGAMGERRVVVDMLVAKPDLLTRIVKQLSRMLGRSPSVDALVALVFVIVFRSAGSALLVSPTEIDQILLCFFRNCSVSLLEAGTSSREPKPAERKDDEKQNAGRRRGIFARRTDQGKSTRMQIKAFNDLVAEAGVMEDDGVADSLPAFVREVDGASYLFSATITSILDSSPEVRVWMRENRRLDRIVGVIYLAENAYSDRGRDSIDGGWRIVIGAAFRVLEFIALDKVCQSRICAETRIVSIAVNLLRQIGGVRVGSCLDSDWVICNALRVCINLLQGYTVGTPQFAHVGGVSVVLDCLVSECIAAGLLDGRSNQGEIKDKDEDSKHVRSEEGYDVRVLCLTLLASVVYWELKVCEEFPTMQSNAVKEEGGDALELVLEILKRASSGGGADRSDDANLVCDVDMQDVTNEVKDRETPNDMDRKITIGYSCLLIGALVRKSTRNRSLLIERLRPKRLDEIAVVLQEFLEFHHEVGVMSASLNAMYEGIIAALLDEVRVDDSPVEIGDGAAEVDESLDLDSMMDIDDQLVAEEVHREMREEEMRTIGSEDGNTLQMDSTA